MENALSPHDATIFGTPLPHTVWDDELGDSFGEKIENFLKPFHSAPLCLSPLSQDPVGKFESRLRNLGSIQKIQIVKINEATTAILEYKDCFAEALRDAYANRLFSKLERAQIEKIIHLLWRSFGNSLKAQFMRIAGESKGGRISDILNTNLRVSIFYTLLSLVASDLPSLAFFLSSCLTFRQGNFPFVRSKDNVLFVLVR